MGRDKSYTRAFTLVFVSSQGEQQQMLPGGNTKRFSAQGQPGDVAPVRSQPTSLNLSGVKPWANACFEDSSRFAALWRSPNSSLAP